MRRVAGILLAAGEARRFGRHKLLAPLADGTPLAIASARKLFAVIPDSVIVLRENDSALAALCDREGWRTVICRDAAEGMGRSLASGVDAAADADAWIIALADMPYINEETVARVAQAMARGASIVAPFYAGQRGHPVGISANHRDQLMALRGDHGARAILERAGQTLDRIDVDDPGVLRDVDTPGDLEPVTATSASPSR